MLGGGWWGGGYIVEGLQDQRAIRLIPLNVVVVGGVAGGGEGRGGAVASTSSISWVR
jgi:hypothetical protein